MAEGSTRLTILGGGPAGVAVAHYAHARGLAFTLYERSSHLGGLCRTLRCGDHGYDTGAHRFHDRDPEITSDLKDLMGDELLSVEAPSQIFDQGKRIDFPPRPANWIRAHGLTEGVRIGWEVLRARISPRPEVTFEDLVANRYGLRLGRRALIDYSEKLWGLPASQLAPDVATRRLAGLSVRVLLTELFWRSATTRHLDGRFLYPRRGYGAIAERLVRDLPAKSLRTGCEVAGLNVAGSRITGVRFADGTSTEAGDRVINTLPLTAVARMVPAALGEDAISAARELRFRHVRLIFLRLSVERASANATVYLPDPALAVARVSEPKNRSASLAPAHETSLTAEVPCSDGEPLAALPDEELAERVIAELDGVGLIDRGSVLEWRHHLLANAYPVYAVGFRERVGRLVAGFSRLENLDLLGRGGKFWYSHLHDHLRAAKDYVADLPSR